jgi:hypothetical protein
MAMSPDSTAAAARLALRAPSALNSQRWRVGADEMQLRADRWRQLATTDSDGRLPTGRPIVRGELR